MILDTRTLVLVISTQFFVMGVYVLVTATKHYPPAVQKSMRFWGWSYLLQTAAWLIGGLRSLIPDFFAIVVVNSLLFWAQMETYRSLRIFDEQPPSRKFSAVVAAMVLAIFLSSLLLRNNLVVHIITIAVVTVLPVSLCGLHLISARHGKPGKVRYILAIGFGLLTVIYTARVFALLTSKSASTTPIQANTLLQSIVYGGTAISVLILSIGFMGMCMEKFNDALLRLAVTDELTGIYNRREIKRLAEEAIEQARNTQQSLAFLLLDADNFKIINDRYGHLAGDAALQAIANTVKTNLRSEDIVGRLGGDEFVVVLPNTPGDVAREVAERIVSAVKSTPFCYDGRRIKLGISIGAAMLTHGEQDFEQLFHNADKRMYEMKPRRKKSVLAFEKYYQKPLV